MRRFVYGFVVALVCLCTTASAEVLTPGTIYKGGTTVEVPTANVAFTTPKGWSGSLPQGSEFFVLQQGNGDDGNIFMWATEATKAEVVSTMSQPMPISAGIQLQPTSKPKTKGERVDGQYKVTCQDGLAATIITKTHKSGVAVAIIAIYADAAQAKYKKVSESLYRSVKFKKAAAPVASKSSGPWAQSLANKRLTRFHTVSGYSEKETYVLCADGRFFRNFDASSVSQLGTGAANSKGDGTWSVSGDTLNFLTSSGTDSVVLEDRDGKLFIGDRRWFREDINCN